ncbi:unnamed protein product [Enterobius vermicularis]|uniref:DUF2052 domain-containing protein n=1 Tax=Enterobius vermicularis TaxID=51028 RepID=A0A0N4UYC2_ENTVE|nr:unnamed protein product [Enterobius vermicularis]
MADTDAMFKRIMDSEGVFYKLQQRGDPDLTEEEKNDITFYRIILRELFEKKPRIFISRYFSYLLPEDCHLFSGEDYDISFYIKKITENQNGTEDVGYSHWLLLQIYFLKVKTKRNVRFAELERLKKESDYFSYAKMREREPLLFDRMIGRFLPEEEQFFLRPTIENESLSGLLMQFEDSQVVSDRRKMQVEEDAFGFQLIRRLWCGIPFKIVSWSLTAAAARQGLCNELVIIVYGNLSEMKFYLMFFYSSFTQVYSNLEFKSQNGADISPSTVKFEKMALHAECRQSPEDEVQEELEGEIGSLSLNSETSRTCHEEMMVDSENELDEEQLKSEFIDFMEQKFLRGWILNNIFTDLRCFFFSANTRSKYVRSVFLANS